MRFWPRQDVYEIEEARLSRKAVLDNLPEKQLAKIEWPYEEWEKVLVENCAEFGYSITVVSQFLYRADGDLQNYVRKLGYANWTAYCRAIQCNPSEGFRRGYKPDYREILEAAMGRPLTKEEIVHHINCDHEDDALANLWVCNNANHRHAHASYRKLQRALIACDVIHFDRENGEYTLNPDAIDDFEEYWADL